MGTEIIENTVRQVLAVWNENVKKNKLDAQYILTCKCIDKKHYLNKEDFYEQRVAEITLVLKGRPTLLLWRKQLIMPKKIKGMGKAEVDESYIQSLYKTFLYECIGNFCMATKALIESQDYAEYDIENDRLKQHESAKGMVISVIDKGDWYEAGNKFDVFMVTDKAYFVYTAIEAFIKNNGIAKINKDKCMIIENAKPSILLL